MQDVISFKVIGDTIGKNHSVIPYDIMVRSYEKEVGKKMPDGTTVLSVERHSQKEEAIITIRK